MLKKGNHGESEVGSMLEWVRNCGLHPLIHTFLKFNLAQDVEKKKSGAENSAFS